MGKFVFSGRQLLGIALSVLVLWGLSGCKPDRIGPQRTDGNSELPAVLEGLYIANEGNFGWGNGSVSFFNPLTRERVNYLFEIANGRSPGDVVQSIVRFGDEVFIVVNNSRKIEVVDVFTWKQKRTLKGFDSPRNIFFLNADTALVTELWNGEIAVIHPTTGKRHATLSAPGWTEKIVAHEGKLWVQVRNGQAGFLVLDPKTWQRDTLISVPDELADFMFDPQGNLWYATEKSFEDITLHLRKKSGESQSTPLPHKAGNLTRLHAYGGEVYLLSRHLYRFSAFPQNFPLPLVKAGEGTEFYGLWMDDSGIYLTDAKDFVTPGELLHFSLGGDELHRTELGLIPGKITRIVP